MEKITKEQIETVTLKAAEEASKQVSDLFITNAEFIGKKMQNNQMEGYSLYFAALNTAFQMSVQVIQKSLCDMFCDQ